MTERLSLEFAPEWNTIKGAWEPCQAHLSKHGLDADGVYALCMVTHELLENAVKYGAFGPDQTIRCSVVAGKETVTIEVRTPLGVDRERFERLDRMIQWIRSFQNPFEAFVERLKDVSARPFAVCESGLGLVRMAYEGQCLLDFYVDDSDVLSMSAVYRVPPASSDAASGQAGDVLGQPLPN